MANLTAKDKTMQRTILFGFIILCGGSLLCAQTTNWESAGLEQAWQFQVPTHVARMGFPSVVPYVSGVEKRTVYEVSQEGGPTSIFTSGQVDRAGVVLDDAAAARQADIELRTLKALGHESAVLNTRQVPQVRLLVQTGSGQLLLLDGETGQLDWSLSVGEWNAPTYPPAIGEHHAVAVRGSHLYMINLATGKLEHDHLTRGIPDAAPAIASRTVVLPTMRGPFEVYSLVAADMHRPPRLRASFGRATSPPVGTPQSIAWATDRGFLFLADPIDAIPQARIVVRQGILGAPAFVPPDHMVMTVADGYVLAVGLERQLVAWEFFTGQSISEPPYALGDTIYVTTAENRLYALNSEDGRLKWRAPGVSRVVNGLDERLFCESPDGQLITVDAANGQIQGAVNLGLGDQLLTNKLTDRIYLVRHNGVIECLRASGARWPTLHLPLPEVLPEDEPPAAGEEVPTTAADKEPHPVPQSTDAENPFAVPADEEPVDEEPNPFAADEEDGSAARGRPVRHRRRQTTHSLPVTTRTRLPPGRRGSVWVIGRRQQATGNRQQGI